MAADFQYLEKRHQCWYCVLDVPRKLRAALGKKRFIVSLDTRDIHVARARRWAARAKFQTAIDAATKATTMPPELQVGLAYRELFAVTEGGDLPLVGGYTVTNMDGQEVEVSPEDRARELTADALHDALCQLERDVGYERAKAAADMAYGRATPLLVYLGSGLILARR